MCMAISKPISFEQAIKTGQVKEIKKSGGDIPNIQKLEPKPCIYPDISDNDKTTKFQPNDLKEINIDFVSEKINIKDLHKQPGTCGPNDHIGKPFGIDPKKPFIDELGKKIKGEDHILDIRKQPGTCGPDDHIGKPFGIDRKKPFISELSKEIKGEENNIKNLHINDLKKQPGTCGPEDHIGKPFGITPDKFK